MAIRLPKIFAMQFGVDFGKEVEITFTKNTVVISKPSTPALEMLIKDITSENVHEEIDTGEVTGKEIW